MSKVFIVRFSRYSIYKVQCRSPAFTWCPLRTFICQHILFSLSRTFFKFLKNFLSCGCPPVFGVHQTTFICQHIEQSLSRTFFQFSQISFQSALFCRCVAFSLHILPLSSAFVNRYFQIFFRNKHMLILGSFCGRFPLSVSATDAQIY